MNKIVQSGPAQDRGAEHDLVRRTRRPAVDQQRARAAVACLATPAGAQQSQPVTNDVQKRLHRIHLDPSRSPVRGERDCPVHEGLLVGEPEAAATSARGTSLPTSQRR